MQSIKIKPNVFVEIFKNKAPFFLILQTCFNGTSVIVSVTVMKTSVEFYSAQITMYTLHYVTWIQRYNGTRMHVNLTKMTVSQGAYKERVKLMCLTC